MYTKMDAPRGIPSTCNVSGDPRIVQNEEVQIAACMVQQAKEGEAREDEGRNIQCSSSDVSINNKEGRINHSIDKTGKVGLEPTSLVSLALPSNTIQTCHAGLEPSKTVPLVHPSTTIQTSQACLPELARLVSSCSAAADPSLDDLDPIDVDVLYTVLRSLLE